MSVWGDAHDHDPVRTKGFSFMLKISTIKYWDNRKISYKPEVHYALIRNHQSSKFLLKKTTFKIYYQIEEFVWFWMTAIEHFLGFYIGISSNNADPSF